METKTEIEQVELETETPKTEAQKRAEFLASLEYDACGRGLDDCDGSEGTCTCN